MTLEEVAQQHKQRILTREAAATAKLRHQFQATWERILTQLTMLLRQMQQAKDAGRNLDVGWLYEAHRLQHLLDALAAEIGGFALSAKSLISGDARLAHAYGVQDARLLLQTSLPQIGLAFGVPSADALKALEARLSTGPLARRFAQMPEDAVTRTRQVLLAGVAHGWGPRQIARWLKQQLGIELSDALRLARTESMMAYRSASLDSYRANSDVCTGWTWLASANACDDCAAKNGTQHPLDEDMDEHPNGRCCPVPNTVSYDQILAGAVA